ncbi:hypothetical protein [Halomonas halodenitrificans]|uniref:hypothetical protein n=1 Tax=Halomonas halodenitrificans TaxID=28252 RepID=UPI0004860083|nr:hypothetical protein [Halomonas halodenitrificans]
MIRFDADGLTREGRHSQPPCIVSQDAVAPVPGLGGHQGKENRHGSLYLAISVAITEQGGWTRIGRLMLDAGEVQAFDETDFCDWLDDVLESLHAESLADLRLALQPRLIGWFADHLRRLPEIHLQILAMEAPMASQSE